MTWWRRSWGRWQGGYNMTAKEWFDEFWNQVLKVALTLFVLGLMAWGLLFVVMWLLYA